MELEQKHSFFKFDEFVELMKDSVKEDSQEKQLLDAFKVFDKNGDGLVLLNGFLMSQSDI
jgi:Ca2+-binding EF-hand superfamily protein